MPNILLSREQLQVLHNEIRQIEKDYLVPNAANVFAVDWMAMRDSDPQMFFRYIQIRRVVGGA